MSTSISAVATFIPRFTDRQRPHAPVHKLRGTMEEWLMRPPVLESTIAQVQRRLEWYGARAAIEWLPGMTIREYAGLLRPLVKGTADALQEVVCLVEQAQYSDRGLNSDEQQRLRNASERVWRQIRHLPRHAGAIADCRLNYECKQAMWSCTKPVDV